MTKTCSDPELNQLHLNQCSLAPAFDLNQTDIFMNLIWLQSLEKVMNRLWAGVKDIRDFP